jgi:predicted phage tail protein
MVTPVKSNQQHIFIHDALVEGPIDGLLYGDASVFLNENRVKDIDPDAPWTPVNGKIEFTSNADIEGLVTSANIPSTMAGTPKNNNFIVLRSAGISKQSSAPVGTTGNISIVGSSDFSIEYNTYNQSAVIANQFLFSPGSLTTPNITDGGTGYAVAPTIKVRNSTTRAVVPDVTATGTITNGILTSVSLSGSGNSNLTGTYEFEVSAPELIDNRFIALADPVTNDIVSVGEGKWSSGSTLIFIPSRINYNQHHWLANNAIPYKVQVIEAVEITSIASNTNTITIDSAPTLGTGIYSFTLTGSQAPSADEVDAENPASSNNFVSQFRAGHLFQDPISELNGVASGTPYTVSVNSLSNTILRQINFEIWNANNPSDTLTGAQVHPTTGYPEGQSITSEGNTEPFILEGGNFSTNPDVVKSLDEVRISIGYSSLQAIRKDTGDDIYNHAKYLFQIARKAPGATGFEKYKHAFKSADGTSVGQIEHRGKDRSAVSFEHYIDLSLIKPFDDFKIRIFRLSRPKGRGVGQGGGDQPSAWDTDQGDSTSSIQNIVGIDKDNFTYPYTAHIGLFLDSREYTSVPKRSYEIRGMKVKVPEGYKPREYSGAVQAKTNTAGTTANYSVPTYPTFWSGSFSDELYYTNNPVWVFLDIITNDRFGAGEWIKLSDIDIYSLYRVSKYCDELVPDGKGGFEPRFTANLYLSKATDVYKVVKDMATIFSSLVYWMDGKLSTIMDSPGDPVYSFSKANVIDGAFVYESTGQKTRVNQVVVTWNKPESGYAQTNLIVEDRNDIVSSGRIISENAVAFGCTSEGQARRYGKWKLFTAQGQTEIVSFRTSFEGLFLKPGDIIEVQDASRYGSTLSGRVAAADTSGDDTITVDRPLTLDTATYNYKLNILITEPAAFYVGEDALELNPFGTVVSSGGTSYSRGTRITTNLYVWNSSLATPAYEAVEIDTEEKASNAFYLDSSTYRPIELSWKKDTYVESKPVTSSTNTSASGNAEITIDGSFSVAPAVSSIWMLEETYKSGVNQNKKTTGSPDLYKVLGIAQDEKNIYSISAVEHYNEKYAFVDDPDSIIEIPEDVYPVESEVIAPPTSVRILQNSNATRPNEELILEWDYPEFDSSGDPTNRFLDSFEVLHTIPGRESSIITNNRTRTFSLENVPDGTYMFRVRAISVSQKKSAWTSFKYTVIDPFNDKVNRIKGIQTEGLTSVYPFITNESLSAGGNFRGYYDVSLGAYDGSTNTEGYKIGDIVVHSSTSKYLPNLGAGGSATDITTWKEYRGGLLKFSGTSNAIVAPSRFRRDIAENFGSSVSIDCNFLRKRASEYIGESSDDGRFAYLIVKNREVNNSIVGELILASSTVDRDFGVLYWYDLLHADNSANTGVYKYWQNLSTGSGRNCSIDKGSNKVTGTGTDFTELSNLDLVLFTQNLFTGSSQTNVSFTASTKTINVGSSYGFLTDGSKIEIKSSSGINQGRFTVVSRTPTTITVQEALVDETAGATIDIEVVKFIAKVARVESGTVMYLDRIAPIDVVYANHGTVFKQDYAPDYTRDCIAGRIRNTSRFGTGDFQFDNFLTFDPNLRGGRDVQLDSNIAFLQFNADQEQVLAPDNITITATAFGFDKPKFKITYGDPTTAPADGNGQYTIFEAEDATHNSPAAGALTVYKKEIWDGENPITWMSGGNINIHVEVIEENDPGDTSKQATDIISIPRVGNVAAGEGGRTVFLELEDYDIVYNSGGVQPRYTGGPTYTGRNDTSTDSLRLTATAGAGFGDAIFRFKVGGTVVPASAGGADWFDPGGDIAFVEWPVPYSLSTTSGGVTTTPFGSKDGGSLIVVVEVAEKPTGWSSTAGNSANEPAAADIYAKDVDNILALRVGAGGITPNFTNDSHVVPCTPLGEVVTDANDKVLNSGGVMKVFSGGVALKYVTSSPVYGEWTISGTSTTDDYSGVTQKGIQVGTITQVQETGGDYVAVVPDHLFKGSIGDPFEETESITYTITVPLGAGESDATVSVSQTFALVKAGQGGVGQVYLYKSAAASPTPSGPTASFPQVKVTLQTAAIDTTGTDPNGAAVYDGDDEGWYTTASAAAAAGSSGQIVWVVAAAVSGFETFAYIENDDWTSPAQFNGTQGFNSATIEIFQGTNSLTAPTLPQDVTYTFETGAISTGLGSWSTTMPSPSRSAPYVWRSAAAAIGNNPTTVIDGVDNPDTDGEDWSTPIIVNRFVEDGIALELTNDAETVGAATSSTALSSLSIATTAKVFQGGSDISSHWTFTAVGATGITVNSSGTGTDGNTFTVTALSSAFQSGNVVITATADNPGTYAGSATRSVNFTVTKVSNGQDGVSYRITTSDAAVVYDPNSNPVSWSPTSVTFSASKVTPTGSTSFTTGYWKLNGSNQGQASSVSSGTISSTSGNITAQLYLDSGYSQLVDTESVPIISKGTDGTDGADSTVPGDDGAPGPRSVFAYIYYQSSSSSAPTVPALSTFTPNFTNGSVSSSNSNWGTNTPTFQAGNTNKYWYFTFTATESGTYANGAYPNVTKSSSPSAGSSAIQGIGFTGLVTFTGDDLTDGSSSYNPATVINSNTTTINGGKITTGTITAEKLNFYDSTNSRINISSFFNDEGFIDSSGLSGYLTTSAATSTYLTITTAASTYQAAGSYLTTATTGSNLTNFSGIATAAGIAYEADLYDPANPSGGVDATFKSALTAAGLSLSADFFDGSGNINSTFSANLTAAGLFLDSSLDASSDSGLSVVNNKLKLTSSSLTLTSTQVGLGNVANSNPADQVKGAFTSVTAITAGSINLKSGSAGIDISATNQKITITDTNGAIRVVLGQL